MAWTLARSIRAAFDQANALYPGRSKASDGTIGDQAHSARKSDHNPCADHSIVHAGDFTHDPGDGFDAHAWVRRLAAHGDQRVKYLISMGQIWNPASEAWATYRRLRAEGHSRLAAARMSLPGWRTYTGSNPHDRHAHVSIKHTDAARNDTSPWFYDDTAPPQPTAIVINAGPTYEDATMQPHFVSLHSGGARLDGNGNGYWDLPSFPFDRTVTVNPNVANPPEGGYNVPDVGFLRWGAGIRVVAEEAVAGGGLDVVIWLAGP